MIIKTSPDEIENFLTDASNLKGNCSAVYFPESTADVVEILKEANANETKVTAAGNGTGLTGARVPNEGIVISTEKLNKILEINESEKYAVVEPGVILSDFLALTKEKNLLYPPDPTEKNCFIGGTIATNASGEKTFKYGPTRDYVLQLEIVLADGEVLEIKRGEFIADDFELSLTTKSGKEIKLNLPDYQMPSTKNASGYFCKRNMDAIDLFIGSEGTLGVITKAKLKLLPYPENILSCIIFFDDEKNALSFIKSARDASFEARESKSQNSLDALALEFFDECALNFLRPDYSNIPANAKAGVWFEQEVQSANEDGLMEQWMNLISEFNGDEESAWFAFSETDKIKIQKFRHDISSKVNEYISKNNFRKLGTDVAVPNQYFEELFYYAKNAAKQAGLDYVAYGHFGNSHLHLNMLPKNEDEFSAGKKVYKNICGKAIELHGTISAEHGVGKIKTEYLLEMYGAEVIKKMKILKQSLDHNMILGIGNIF